MERKPDNSSILVLIADDDPLMHEMVRHALDPDKFSTISVDNGREAVEYFKIMRPHLVLLDVKMPELDGFAACQQIRQYDPEATVPVVMITGLDDIKSIVKSYHSGADDFITKPITWPTLQHRLSYLHRGNLAVQKVKAQIRSEQALYYAIPDSIVIFDANYRVKKLHQGKQHYLFSDLVPGSIEGGQVIDLLREYLQLLKSESPTSPVHNDFINKIEFEQNTYYLECRKAQLDDDEIVLVIRDITQRKRDEERILTLVLYDTLTGLPNRKYLEEHLARDIASSRRNSGYIALLFLNVKGFSKINDTYGLAMGDELIIAIGKRLSTQLREYDLTSRPSAQGTSELSRFAGDEFAVVLQDVESVQDVEAIAQRIKSEIALPFEINGVSFVVDLYIGCGLYPANAADAAGLIASADSAMHLNKQSQGETVSFFDLALNQSSKRQHLIEIQLRHALEKKEFSLVIQPKVHLHQTGNLSAEVLLRWRNETLGNVSPAEFIPIAEQTGLIIEITKWVFEQSCHLSRVLRTEHELNIKLAVNISPQVFLGKQDFPDYVSNILEEFGLDAKQFELEVTEYVLMHKAEETLATFNRLQSMGFSIALDDFGTGYSSLSYLSRFDIDTLKIDRLFVSTLNRERSQKLVRTMVVMAQQLGMATVAEGVETDEELSFLKELKCDFVQGYLLAKPLPFSEFIEFYRADDSNS